MRITNNNETAPVPGTAPGFRPAACFSAPGSLDEKAGPKRVVLPQTDARPAPQTAPQAAVTVPTPQAMPQAVPQAIPQPYPMPQAVPQPGAAAPMPQPARGRRSGKKNGLWLWIALGFFALAIAGLIYWVVTSGALSEVRARRQRQAGKSGEDASVPQIIDEDGEPDPEAPGIFGGEEEDEGD